MNYKFTDNRCSTAQHQLRKFSEYVDLFASEPVNCFFNISQFGGLYHYPVPRK